MIADLLNRRDPLRVLLALYQRGGMRFNQIQVLLGLNPAQVDRALKFLLKNRWLEAPPRHAEYKLGAKGNALAEAFTAFTESINRKKNELGGAEIARFQDFYLPVAADGVKIFRGNSGATVTIRPFPGNEKEEASEYRAGVLMLPPEERIRRMRELSRRVILLNPKNPRSPRIKPYVRITHDAFKQLPPGRLRGADRRSQQT